MKILLLRPYYGVTVHGDMHGDLGLSDYCPAVFPDLSLIYSATVASRSNLVELDVIDANAEKLLPSDVNKKLRNNYDFIIIKAAAPTIKYDIEYAKDLKKNYPNAKLIMAGHIVKIMKKWIRNNVGEVDEILEIPMENYLYKLLYKESDDLKLNDIPSPDYSLFPYEKYTDYTGVPFATLQMSRGCVVGCSYCPYVSFFGRRFDCRSPQNVVEDIKKILNLGINFIQFRDQYFTYDKKNVTDLCNMIINQNLKFDWVCETKIESLDAELIDLMAEAGMKKILFGVESASKETLKKFKRPTYNALKIKKLINYMKGKNIETVAFYIIGFPHDTWESIQNTYNLSTYLGSKYATFFVYSPIVFPEGSDNEINPEITPEMLVPFSYTLTKNLSKHFTVKELEYLSNQLAIMYHSSMHGLEHGYKYHYINQTDFSRAVKMTGDSFEDFQR